MATRGRSSRRDAVQRIVATRRATLALVVRLPESEIVRRRTQWSIMDVLACPWSAKA